MFKYIRLVFLCVILVASSLAHAVSEWDTITPGGTTPVEACTPASGMLTSLDPDKNNFIGTLISYFVGGNSGAENRMTTVARSIASQNVKPLALQVGGMLAVLSILFASVTAAIEGRSIAGDVFDVVLKAAVVAGVLSQYDTIVGAGLEQLGKGLTAISGTDSPGQILGLFIKNILKAIISPILVTIDQIGCVGIWKISAGIIGELLIVILITCISIALLLSALVEALFGLLAGPVILAIAIAVGPLSIACYNNNKTSGAFDKWLSFAISGALMTGIAGIVLRIFSESLITKIDPNSAQSNGLISASFVVLVNVLIAGKIFSHIPDYAAALSPSGGSGAKGGGGVSKGLTGAATAAATTAMAVPGAAMAAGGAVSAAAGVSSIVAASRGNSTAAQAAAGALGFAGSLATQAKDKIISSLKNSSGKTKN
jgi:TrbL/VirB6 plasmid conjugal transfer protein